MEPLRRRPEASREPPQMLVELLVLHMIDGRVIQVNPQQVTQLVHPHEKGNKALVEGVKCVIRLTDGSFASVAETCDEVQKMMEGKKR